MNHVNQRTKLEFSAAQGGGLADFAREVDQAGGTCLRGRAAQEDGRIVLDDQTSSLTIKDKGFYHWPYTRPRRMKISQISTLLLSVFVFSKTTAIAEGDAYVKKDEAVARFSEGVRNLQLQYYQDIARAMEGSQVLIISEYGQRIELSEEEQSEVLAGEVTEVKIPTNIYCPFKEASFSVERSVVMKGDQLSDLVKRLISHSNSSTDSGPFNYGPSFNLTFLGHSGKLFNLSCNRSGGSVVLTFPTDEIAVFFSDNVTLPIPEK